MNDTNKTGMFYVKRKRDSGSDIVVIDKGIEIGRYESVDAFVAKHKEGLFAIGRLEENMEKAIESQYTLYPPDPES